MGIIYNGLRANSGIADDGPVVRIEAGDKIRGEIGHGVTVVIDGGEVEDGVTVRGLVIQQENRESAGSQNYALGSNAELRLMGGRSAYVNVVIASFNDLPIVHVGAHFAPNKLHLQRGAQYCRLTAGAQNVYDALKKLYPENQIELRLD